MDTAVPYCPGSCYSIGYVVLGFVNLPSVQICGLVRTSRMYWSLLSRPMCIHVRFGQLACVNFLLIAALSRKYLSIRF